MKYVIPSASRIELAQHCAYAFNSGRPWPKRPSTPAQRFGIAFAEASEVRGRGEVPAIAEIAAAYSLTESDERRLRIADERVVEVLAVDGAEWSTPEDPYALDLGSGRMRRLAREERALDGEMYGRTDLTFYRHASRVPLVVRDFKTGIGARNKRPSQTPQLRFLAAAAAAVHGERSVRVELALVDEPDEIKIVGEDMDALELGAVEGEIAELVERLEAAPEPRPGPWCGHCPLATECPATTAALARVEGDLEAYPLQGAITSAEHASHNRHRLKVLRELLDARENEIEDFARRSPLPVEGKPGLYWGLVQHDGNERVDASPAALELLREELGAHAEIAIEKDVSKASIERALKAMLAEQGAKRGMLTKAKAGLLERLRGAKLVRRGSPYSRFEEFKRGEEAAAE